MLFDGLLDRVLTADVLVVLPLEEFVWYDTAKTVFVKLVDLPFEPFGFGRQTPHFSLMVLLLVRKAFLEGLDDPLQPNVVC